MTKEVTLSGTSTKLTTLTLGRDIFKDGASPELEAKWAALDAAIAEYAAATPERKQELLTTYPEIRDDVICPECMRDL